MIGLAFFVCLLCVVVDEVFSASGCLSVWFNVFLRLADPAFRLQLVLPFSFFLFGVVPLLLVLFIHHFIHRRTLDV